MAVLGHATLSSIELAKQDHTSVRYGLHNYLVIGTSSGNWNGSACSSSRQAPLASGHSCPGDIRQRLCMHLQYYGTEYEYSTFGMILV